VCVVSHRARSSRTVPHRDNMTVAGHNQTTVIEGDAVDLVGRSEQRVTNVAARPRKHPVGVGLHRSPRFLDNDTPESCCARSVGQPVFGNCAPMLSTGRAPNTIAAGENVDSALELPRVVPVHEHGAGERTVDVDSERNVASPPTEPRRIRRQASLHEPHALRHRIYDHHRRSVEPGAHCDYPFSPPVERRRPRKLPRSGAQPVCASPTTGAGRTSAAIGKSPVERVSARVMAGALAWAVSGGGEAIRPGGSSRG